MKKAITVLTAAALLAITGPAFADDPTDEELAKTEELAKKKGCTNCHALEQRRGGPPIKEIAAKHQDDESALETLVARLTAAEKHPRIRASEDELRTIIHYMLTR